MINDVTNAGNCAVSVNAFRVLRVNQYGFVSTINPWLSHDAGEITQENGNFFHRSSFLHLLQSRWPTGTA